MTVFKLSEDQAPEIDPKTKEPVSIGLTAKPKAVEAEEGSGKIKEIVLKGPLSHAYTEALNLLLDKQNKDGERELRQENVYQAIQANIFSEEANGDPSVPEEAKAYVYVYDGKRIGTNEVMDIVEEAALKKQGTNGSSYVSAVIENPDYLTGSNAKNLEDNLLRLEKMNVPVYFSKTAALSGISAFLRK